MNKSRVLSFSLLFVFLSFLICEYPGGHANAYALDESKAVTSFSDAVEGFLLKDDIKKSTFFPASGTETIVYLSLIFFIYSSLVFLARRKLIFFTPIFYQSNYVIPTP